MIHVYLSNDEKLLMEDLVNEYLEELWVEIRHTDQAKYKEQLKSRREVLKKLLEALKSSIAEKG